MELAKVFATELEHYEKVEGEPLSLEGKSNKLAGWSRPPADGDAGAGGRAAVRRVDPRTGRAASSSTTRSAAATSRPTRPRPAAARWRPARRSSGWPTPSADLDDAVRTALEALFDAAEEDSATGGPDLIRRIYPIVAVIDADGYRELADDEVAAPRRGRRRAERRARRPRPLTDPRPGRRPDPDRAGAPWPPRSTSRPNS
jgi:proteasome beta subunit